MKQLARQIGPQPCTSCEGCMFLTYDSSKIVGNFPVGLRIFGCQGCGYRHSQILGRTDDCAMSAGWAALVAAIGAFLTGPAFGPAVSGANPVVRNPGVAW